MNINLQVGFRGHLNAYVYGLSNGECARYIFLKITEILQFCKTEGKQHIYKLFFFTEF